jgi:hypothetical protein
LKLDGDRFTEGLRETFRGAMEIFSRTILKLKLDGDDLQKDKGKLAAGNGNLQKDNLKLESGQ